MRIARPLLTALVALGVALAGIAPLGTHAQGSTVTLTLTIPTSLSDIYSAKFLAQFEDSHPGIKVQLTRQNPTVPQAAFDLDKHFEGAAKYVTSGDVVYVTTGVISEEDTQAGYFLDMAPLVSDDKTLNPDDFFPAIWQSYQWDKGIWALPVSADPFVLLYNPDVFDKAGLAYPNDQW
ncbi:MAG TPA: ABC transporter substrate-binding protein, partial [Aggregatilineales bacterium]|nr:ABC transporter substrate-binding protein [Aggregatilineales bacterium]